MSLNAAKRAAAVEAVQIVQSRMTLGLGTGSTTAFAIAEIGRRIREEALDVRGVATSFAAELLADEHGVPLTDLKTVEVIDVAFDGADEVDPGLNLIKGRGGAHTREKIVASLARRFVVLVDDSKLVDRLGSTMPLPIEVVPMAAFPVMRRLESLGARATLRVGGKKDGPVVSDQGFWIIDAEFDSIDDPAVLDETLRSVPGVLDHGLFLGMATDVFVGRDDGGVRRLTRHP